MEKSFIVISVLVRVQVDFIIQEDTVNVIIHIFIDFYDLACVVPFCASCPTGSSCSGCISSFYLHFGNCESPCPYGYYGAPSGHCVGKNKFF